jgi:RsiW-degrading membrane proteinase PrsW (M82 family)
MEKYENKQAAKTSFLFYTMALLIWTLYDLIKNGERGLQFLILMIGTAIFFWTRVYYKRKYIVKRNPLLNGFFYLIKGVKYAFS